MAQENAQSKSELLPAEVRREIDRWLAKYPDEQKRSAVVSALTFAQEHNNGWLTTELMDAVADYLDLPSISVYEVATFYSMLNLEPVGRHIISICNNISCMLCGADEIVAYVENKLGIKLGQTTSDGRITLKIEEECLAACAGGPMMAVDGHYHEHLTPQKVDDILDALE
ncbi:MAG: NADH-quinone oxidoreductase subunit NuoE [Gammaproteobacteria bacterium]